MNFSPIRVAVNGYGVIGKRVAEAVSAQEDLELAGVSDIGTDWRPRMASHKGFRLFGAAPEHAAAMRGAGLDVNGTLDELLNQADVFVDCTPKRVAAKNVEARARDQVHPSGWREARRYGPLLRGGGELRDGARPRVHARGVLQHHVDRAHARGPEAGRYFAPRARHAGRATDPWESHQGGIINTLVPEEEIPSHQGPDAQSVDPNLDVVTMAVKVPETLAHLHYWVVEMTREASKDEGLDAFRASSRISLIKINDGLSALNTVKELMADLGRPHDNLYAVALWADMLKVQGSELFYAYILDNLF